jgi:phosphoglycerate dehydrogenase-like enzyme
MKAIFHYDAGPTLMRKLEALSGGGVSIEPCPEADGSRFSRLMATAEVLFHVLKPVTAEVIAAAPRLRLVQKIGIGVNTIDLEAAKARGIAVANMPGTNSRAVAEMTLMLMLSCLRAVRTFDGACRRGEGWSLGPEIQDRLGEICGRTVGLVGFGAVPAALAPVLAAMGARLLYTDIVGHDGAVAERRDLDSLLAESDIVTLHVPLTEATENMIDADSIARMKPGAILINAARGGLVDQAALVEALGSGQISAAGLDVFVAEPIARDNPLLALDNVVLSPHVAWLTQETLDRSLKVALENCRRIEAGETLLHRVV